MDAAETRAAKAKMMRYNRPALYSMGYEHIMWELEEISEACDEVCYYSEEDAESLLAAFDGDETEVWEFRISFSELSSSVEQLDRAIRDVCRAADYDDCTVALIGNRCNLIGYDSYEEDYYSLCGYDAELANTEAGKRLMRLTKKDMLATIGQSVGVLISFLDVRQRYDYLKAALDVVREENNSILQLLSDIEAAYVRAEGAGFSPYRQATQEFDRLVEELPDRVWLM